MAESAKMEDDVSNSKESEPPILINLTNGKIFIWDAEDVMKVREVHHIMGTLVGTLSRSPRQNIQHGLPLQLLPEEAALLIEYNVAKLVKLKPLKVSAAMVEDFKKHRQQSFEEQKVIMKQGKETIEQEMAEVIEAGRAAKRRKKGAGKRWHRNQQVCRQDKISQGQHEEPHLKTEDILQHTDEPQCEVLDLSVAKSNTNIPSSKSEYKETDTKEGMDIENIEGNRTTDLNDGIAVEKHSGSPDSLKSPDRCKSLDQPVSPDPCHVKTHDNNDMRTAKNDKTKERSLLSSTSQSAEKVENDGDKEDSDIFQQACMVQIPTVSPYSEYEDNVTWVYPTNEQETLRYRVYKYFWEQGYFVTTGAKFGGDYLVYPGDPFLFHSFYVVVCLPFRKRLSALDAVAYGRLASNVKKTVVLCSLNDENDIVNTSIQWTGIS